MDMRNLETDNEAEAEAGDADQGITEKVNHFFHPVYASLASSSTIGIKESVSEHSVAITINRFV